MKKNKEKFPIETNEKTITWTPEHIRSLSDEFVGDLSESETLNLITDIPETTTPKNKPSMEWSIRIENKPDQRILVVFEPQYERIIFIGQRKIRLNWITFSEESHPMEIDFEAIQDLLLKVYKTMNKRIEIHDDLINSFGLIKIIEINEE
jgi:hypothetical protein